MRTDTVGLGGFGPLATAGDDWNGFGGGNTDLGDPVYAVAHGVVVYSKDYGSTWGNLVIIRHAYRRTKDSKVYYIDSLYAHLRERLVNLYAKVRRGQKIGTIGNNHGMYLAHLHFEIRKNINIGPYQTKYAIDYGNYFAPSEFIKENRSLRLEYHLQRVPVDTFGDRDFELVSRKVDRRDPAGSETKSWVTRDSERRV